MSKGREKHRERLPPFVPLELLMLDSKAYQNLTGNAAKLYTYFVRSCVRAKKGKPDTTTLFGFTYTEAVKLGFARKSFYRSMKELVDHGFIDQVEVGGLRGAGHTNSQYRLSNRWLTLRGLVVGRTS